MLDYSDMKVGPVFLVFFPEHVCVPQCLSIETLNACPAHDLFFAEKLEKITDNTSDLVIQCKSIDAYRSNSSFWISGYRLIRCSMSDCSLL